MIFLQKSLLGFDWGVSESLYVGQDVWGKFMEKMPATVAVNLYTMIFAVPLGLMFGIYAALKKKPLAGPFHLHGGGGVRFGTQLCVRISGAVLPVLQIEMVPVPGEVRV